MTWKILFIISPIVLVILLLSYIFPFVEVIGDSMYPTYKDKEMLRGFRLFPKSKIKVGDVIVYKSPDSRIVIKRVANIIPSKFNRRTFIFYCLGDNADNSYDSRNYGYIPQKDIVCRLINQRSNQNEC